jgi:hypothetical protein
LRWQLKHNSNEKERDRRMSIRRDTYLFAAEKIGQQLNFLSGFYQTKGPLPEGYEEAKTKIHIIGSDETIKSLNEYNDHMVDTFAELVPQKYEIDLLEQKIDFITEGLKKGMQDPNKSIEEFKRIFSEHHKLTYELASKCQQKTQLAEELLIPVIVAIRKELDSPFDEKAYREMMKISHNKWKKNIEKYIASMKDKYIHILRWIEEIEQEAKKEIT